MRGPPPRGPPRHDDYRGGPPRRGGYRNGYLIISCIALKGYEDIFEKYESKLFDKMLGNRLIVTLRFEQIKITQNYHSRHLTSQGAKD